MSALQQWSEMIASRVSVSVRADQLTASRRCVEDTGFSADEKERDLSRISLTLSPTFLMAMVSCWILVISFEDDFTDVSVRRTWPVTNRFRGTRRVRRKVTRLCR